MRIIIDEEFRGLIPPLSVEARRQLEANIVADGCRDALVVWEGNDILLDGHNRYEICTRLGLPFDTVEIELADRDVAMDWIDRNSLGRRNLTIDQVHLIQGRVYNRRKKSVGKPVGTILGQNDPISTAELIAKEFNVSERTIRRDGVMAEYLGDHSYYTQKLLDKFILLLYIIFCYRPAPQSRTSY